MAHGEVIAESTKIQEHDDHYNVTVPKRVAEKRGLKGGDLVNWILSEEDDNPDVRFLTGD